MRVLAASFALLLAVLGSSGCASLTRLNEPVPPALNPQISSAAQDDSQSHRDVTSASSAPTGDLEPSLADNDRASVAEQDAAVATPSPVEVSEEHHDAPSAKLSPKTPSARAHDAVIADNRLLELLDRDLDKAFGPLKESRRLKFSQEVIHHPKVRHFIEYYSVTAKNRFRDLLALSGRYMPMIAKVLASEGLPEELGFLALLESEFVVNATSRSGAVGLWQFIPPTGRRYGLRIDRWVDERRDPVKATRAAAAYLKDLHDYYGRWFLATAAYNTGPGNVDKALQKSRAKDFWSIKARLSDETRNFVPRFIAIALIASDPEKYGFSEISYEPPLDYEEVELPVPMTLEALAKLTGSNVGTIKGLNPALLRHATPPGETGYRVNLPIGHAAVFQANLKNKMRQPATVVTHRVQKGETLSSIARRYGLSVRALMDFNGLRTSQLRIGQRLAILLEGLRGTFR